MAFQLADPIKSLPAPNPVLTRLLDALDNSYTSADQICEILESDQSTVTRLLSVANSAYYNMRHQISSVQRAVVLLGVEEVRSICMGTVLMAFMESGKLQDAQGAKSLWLHSLAVQEAARIIAARSGVVNLATAMTAGLLHDMGWVVIMAFFPEKWALLKRLTGHEKMNPVDASIHLNEWHQEAGQALAGHWDLPSIMLEVMSSHHEPSLESTHFDVTGLISLADNMVCAMGYDGGIYPCVEETPEWLAQALGFSEEDLTVCGMEMESRFEELDPVWSKIVGTVN
jgi:HD-like signal output (HDOD) protein